MATSRSSWGWRLRHGHTAWLPPPPPPAAAPVARAGPLESTLQLKVLVCFLLWQVSSGKGHVPPGFPSPRPPGLMSQLPAFLVQLGGCQGLAQLIKHSGRDCPQCGLRHGQGTVPAGLRHRLGERGPAGRPPSSIPPACPACTANTSAALCSHQGDSPAGSIPTQE